LRVRTLRLGRLLGAPALGGGEHLRVVLRKRSAEKGV
jgi:hypothetical protein